MLLLLIPFVAHVSTVVDLDFSGKLPGRHVGDGMAGFAGSQLVDRVVFVGGLLGFPRHSGLCITIIFSLFGGCWEQSKIAWKFV